MGIRVKVEDVSMSFGVVHALKGVSIEINDGEVVGLVGENGAGKSTLLKVLSGTNLPDSGHFILNGKKEKFASVADATRAGISMVYQEQSLLPNISVAENILLGIEGEAIKFGTYSPRKVRKVAAEYLKRVNLDIDPRTRTEDLSFGTRQMIEVAKALAVAEFSGKPPVVLLDEPTSVLERKEIKVLFDVVRSIKKRTSVVFISHRLEEVLEISDRVYVMRDGEVISEVKPNEVSVDELFALMVGRDLTQSYFREELTNVPESSNRLEVKNLSGDGFKDVTFNVKKGEIVSFLGLQDSGRENVARVIFGALPDKSGEVFLDGERYRVKNTTHAVKCGIGYIPSERKTDGVVLAMSVAENLTMSHPDKVTTLRLFNKGKMNRVVSSWIDRLGIKTPGGGTPIRSLSGGNQQKVVLAKWLMDENLRLLILDTPTRGLDVGAKTEIYAILRDLAAKGISILFLADALEEGIFMSHRVFTMKDGKISAEFLSSPGARPERTDVVERML
jgi:ribose transport system ATP-binding protein